MPHTHTHTQKRSQTHTPTPTGTHTQVNKNEALKEDLARADRLRTENLQHAADLAEFAVSKAKLEAQLEAARDREKLLAELRKAERDAARSDALAEERLRSNAAAQAASSQQTLQSQSFALHAMASGGGESQEKAARNFMSQSRTAFADPHGPWGPAAVEPRNYQGTGLSDRASRMRGRSPPRYRREVVHRACCLIPHVSRRTWNTAIAVRAHHRGTETRFSDLPATCCLSFACRMNTITTTATRRTTGTTRGATPRPAMRNGSRFSPCGFTLHCCFTAG